ncbi:MAG: N-acetyltransferase [Cyanobacteria bacterium P01_A01_bin.3]
MQLPERVTLASGLTVDLNEMCECERDSVRSLFNQVVLEGDSYPQLHPLTERDFAAYWLVGKAYVVRGQGDEPPDDIGAPGSILGAFYIKPNFSGRASHICNAGFIVEPRYRGQGIGRFMGTSVLPLAKALGYRAIMFNLVFASNTASIALWKSLGFDTIGRIPNAVRLAGDRYVDALMFYRNLEDIS